MEYVLHKIIYCCLLIIGSLFIHTSSTKVHHLEDRKFASAEYLDPEIDERDIGPELPISPLDQPFYKKASLFIPPRNSYPDKLNPNIKWDSSWASDLDFGQISAVSIDPNGNVGIFHRGERIWDSSTFGTDNKFNINRGPIRQNTIMLLDKTGKVLLEWGKNMFFLPHGLTIDNLGNYWLTDVAMHQVFKFDGKDIEKHKQQLKRQRYSQHNSASEKFDVKNLFANSIIKPSLNLGEAFQPGNDNTRFCKPTAIAVLTNGDFFVSDGYCNSRIIKFNKDGERILKWGRSWALDQRVLSSNEPPKNAFLIPHALALAEEHDLVFVADRENARIICNHASNGSFYKEYKSPMLGAAVYSIAYANNKIYLVNGNRYLENMHIRGYVLDMYSGEILSQFAPGIDMDSPHDLAVTSDEREIYVVELNSHKIYKFNQDLKDVPSNPNTNKDDMETKTLKYENSNRKERKPSQRGIVIVAIIAALLFICFCILLAVLFARYQKRGSRLCYDEPNVELSCLLPPYKRTEWNDDQNDNFKLLSLLGNRKKFTMFENRPNTRDFSKVNTEPETSEDETLDNATEKII
ncbi:peptidyl-alpha-hydroxyglycine alpha-amidating lyase 1 isoform X2 [Phymastichus coffea]|uniref:peptidyl-alpha-hydroxyglycine alpha-amidating lyase 1 isoform X2 n=1 Tax=Phymastichus coffea TaxID=108790 RepID=UPI00273B2A97|nr:peptidyl-alpha-hydroxyglycine alpha-amidating lyase 1 isoform X2 [Phymastichus coffea]